jgi:hypothetical protein
VDHVSLANEAARRGARHDAILATVGKTVGRAVGAMMKRVGFWFVGVLLAVAPLGAVTTSGAAGAATAPRFVGTYQVATSFGPPTWRLAADGNAYAVRGDTESYFGSWFNEKGIVTVRDLVDADTHWYWVGHKTRKGIGTRRKPGTFYVAGHPEGTWYAIRTG